MNVSVPKCWVDVAFGTLVSHSAFGPRFSGPSFIPFVMSLSNHERHSHSPFDKLRANGFSPT